MIRLLACLIVAFASGCGTAAAQTIHLTPAALRQWDVSASIGWLSGNRSDVGAEWNDWYDAFAASVHLGRYWSPHVRTEIAGLFSTEGDFYTNEQIAVAGQPHPVFFTLQHHVRLDAVTASGAYQFFENAWVHPFVAAGAQFARERTRTVLPYPVAFDRAGRRVELPPDVERDGSDFGIAPFVGAGAKLYFTERGYFRTDLSVAFRAGGVSRVVWLAGFGADF